MDVKYKDSEWDKSKEALGTVIGLGAWGKGVIDQLKKVNSNFEDIQNDIRKDDPDGVISFSFTDMESKYQTLFEKIEVLHDYAGDAGNMVERVIDEPFYKDIDKFVEKMEALSIDNYETKNTIGATTIITTGGYDYGGYGATTTTVPKDKIKLSDITAGDNFFADNLKASFADYSKQNPDQEFTYEEYQSAVSSSRAFEYDSIRDGQQNLELWRDIGAAIVIIGVSIVCPPAGLALGVAYGTLELSSAATGKDWMTGREMDGTERATRGAFALLDIIPGVKGIRAFSQATKAGGLALDAAQVGSKLTLRQTAKQGLSHVDAMGRQALRESAERIRNVPRVISYVASTVKNTAQEGLTTVKKMTANFGDNNMPSLNFGGERLVADGFGIVDDAAVTSEKIARSTTKVSEVAREGFGSYGQDVSYMSDFFKGADEGIERGVSAPTLYSVDKADGGKIFVSTDKIRQHHFSDIVNNADGEVTVLSGSHGTADGTLIPEREFFDADIKAWGDTPNVNVLDVNLLSPEQLQKIVTGPGMTVCAWCYSERSVDILKAMGLI